MKKTVFALLLVVTAFYSCKDKHSDLPDGLYADIETNKGHIIVELDYKKAPITVANFVTLAEGKNEFVTHPQLKEKPFFNGLKFHRVIENFMIQTGDPLGTGSGDAGYKFKDEITDLNFENGGVLAMANNGPATNSSQFFITHVATPWLEGKHTVFGHVVANGMEVVNLVKQEDHIVSVTIIRNGEAAKKFDAEKTFGDYFKEESRALKAQQELEAKNKDEYSAKYKAVIEQKLASLAEIKTKAIKTRSGLEYVITQKGNGKKPRTGQEIYIDYSGFLEDGTLFDTSMASAAENFGKLDPARAQAGQYNAIPFEAGRKDGMIPGFIEGIEQLSFGDKATLFIPSHLAYGVTGAGNGVIPPNANIIFEIELLEKMPQQ